VPRNPREAGNRHSASGDGDGARPGWGRVKGLEAGADDFCPSRSTRPSCWRGCALPHQSVPRPGAAQARELAHWNCILEQRVAEGVRQVEQMARLKRFLSPQIADLIVGGTSGNGADDPLKAIGARSPWCFSTCAGSPPFPKLPIPRR
jgi:hypothetical protein